MKGLRRIAAVGLLTMAGPVLASCGSTGPQYPSISFVAGDNCPTTNATAYSPSPPQVNGEKIVGEVIPEMPHVHVTKGTKVGYNHNPPTSGCHYNQTGADPAPIQPGSYDRVVDAEYWVHNLEHGYVAVLYNCPTGCPDEFAKLVAWRKALPPDPAGNGVITYAKAIVMPWQGMPVKFAAVSWDYYQGWNTFDMTAIQAFYDNHVGHSPEGAMTG
jgi:hypothetical protein